MTLDADATTTAARDAARWAELLRDDEKIGDVDRKAFAKWALEAPENVGWFLEEEALEEALTCLMPTPGRHADEWVALARGAADDEDDDDGTPGNALARGEHHDPVVSTKRYVWRSLLTPGLVAVTVIGVLVGGVWRSGNRAEQWVDYSAHSGRTQSIELSDHSVIVLKDKSLVKVRFTNSIREVQLVAGEADFKVQHDPVRRFRVSVVNGTIEAVGTQFDVRLDGGKTDIAASEGRIIIAGREPHHDSIIVSAGEKARITADGRVEVVRVDTSATESNVQSSRVQFNNSTLAEIASAFNERKHSPRFVVEGRACQRQVSAMLNLDNPLALINVLSTDPQLTIEHKGTAVVVIRERGDTSRPRNGGGRACPPPEVLATDEAN